MGHAVIRAWQYPDTADHRAALRTIREGIQELGGTSRLVARGGHLKLSVPRAGRWQHVLNALHAHPNDVFRAASELQEALARC